MAVSFLAVLDELKFVIEPAAVISRTPGLTCLGTIREAPGVGGVPVGKEAHIWHAVTGWAPIDRMELERWLVDAPAGCHWLVSERNLVGLERPPERPDITLVLWGPKQLGDWLGAAVLSGDLSLQLGVKPPSESIEAIAERSVKSELPPPDAVALKPSFKLATWLTDQGFEQLPVRPVLMEGRMWRVEGYLIGPEETRERNRWTLLEDPFTGKVTRLDQVDSLPFIPQLEKISPLGWSSLGSLKKELTSVCEERRHWQVSQSTSDGKVSGSILHWWRIEGESAEMTPSPVFMPGWQVKFPNDGWLLVHGLTGETVTNAEAIQPLSM
jgi:hypothetical protein